MRQKQQPRTKSDVEWTEKVGKEFLARYVKHARLYFEQLSRRTFQSVRRDEESEVVGGGGGGGGFQGKRRFANTRVSIIKKLERTFLTRYMEYK